MGNRMTVNENERRTTPKWARDLAWYDRIILSENTARFVAKFDSVSAVTEKVILVALVAGGLIALGAALATSGALE